MREFDVPGSVVWAIALCALMIGLSKLPDWNGFYLSGRGACSSLFFVTNQSRISNPLLDIGLLIHNKVFAFSNIAALIHYSATTATGFMMSLYLQYVKDLSPREAGMISDSLTHFDGPALASGRQTIRSF